mgnify:CR=1 FL=1
MEECVPRLAQDRWYFAFASEAGIGLSLGRDHQYLISFVALRAMQSPANEFIR